MNNLIKNKKFLLVISKFPPEYSGPGVRIPRLYDWFKENNHDINLQVICNGIEEIKNENYIHKGYKVRRITAEYLNKIFLRLKFVPRRLSQFAIYQYEFVKTFLVLNFCKTYENIDFLHVAGHSGGTAAALLWAKIKNIPVLMELVNSKAQPFQNYLGFFKISVHKKGVIAALTRHSIKKIRDLGFNETQIWFKPNPVDENIYNTDHFDDSSRPSPDYFINKKIILSVAKIIPRKNQLFLIEVMRYLPDNIFLILAGPKVKSGFNSNRDGFYTETIKDKINFYGLEDRISLVLKEVNMREHLKFSSAYLMPAYDEGFGTPMVEAIACGVPVVANQNEVAFQEWIKEGENGFLCDVEQPEKWAYKVLKALEFDKNKKIEMSKDILSKVSNKNIYKDYKYFINKLLKA